MLAVTHIKFVDPDILTSLFTQVKGTVIQIINVLQSLAKDSACSACGNKVEALPSAVSLAKGYPTYVRTGSS